MKQDVTSELFSARSPSSGERAAGTSHPRMLLIAKCLLNNTRHRFSLAEKQIQHFLPFLTNYLVYTVHLPHQTCTEKNVFKTS